MENTHFIKQLAGTLQVQGQTNGLGPTRGGGGQLCTAQNQRNTRTRTRATAPAVKYNMHR